MEKNSVPQQQLLSTDPVTAAEGPASSNIGHNSANSENVSGETISEMTSAAEREIAAYDRAELDCDKTLKAAIYRAIVAIYALLLSIVQNGGLLEFCRAHG